MHEYPFDITTVRLAVILGVLLTTVFYERMQLTTGGAIVPGYLALFAPSPLYIVVTMANALVTHLVVHKLIARRRILYGRRLFEAEVLTSLLVNTLFFAVARSLVPLNPVFVALYGIGFVIPAIIAHDMMRQGARKTSGAVLVNTGVIAVFVYILNALLQASPWYSAPRPVAMGDLGYPPDLLLLGVITSVAAGMVVFRHLNLRTGGFVTGAYLGLMLLRPLDVAFAVGVAALSYVLVTRVVMRHVLAFGRRKLSVMVVTAAILSWAAELAVGAATHGAYVPWRGFHVISLMVPALIANDSERQGLPRTLWGAALTSVAVFTAMNLVDAARLYVAPEWVTEPRVAATPPPR